MLASKINLLTHYAKGTLLLLFIFTLAAYRAPLSIFPSRYCHYRLYTIFSLRGRFPYIQTDYQSILVIAAYIINFFIIYAFGYSSFVLTNPRISFDLFFLKLLRYFNSLRLKFNFSWRSMCIILLVIGVLLQ